VSGSAVKYLDDEFFLPSIALRNQEHGDAVSIVKAGATLVGHTAGPLRPPLSDLKPAQVERLRELISKLGPQKKSREPPRRLPLVNPPLRSPCLLNPLP
jgi:hypothetical protein